jgi:hypothetical protein
MLNSLPLWTTLGRADRVKNYVAAVRVLQITL